MNLEHYRKDAKRLLRAFNALDAEATRRIERALGPRTQGELRLAEAQRAIAIEQGHRSWPALRRAIDQPAPPVRRETVIDTGLRYRPGDPVRVRVITRDHRTTVTDDGAAIARAGQPAHWQRAVERVLAERDVNVSRLGEVSLPVVRAGPAQDRVVERIGAASLALYQELLELDDRD